MTKSSEPIAIVGIGCRFPRAKDADQFWNLIARGETTFSRVPADRWNHEAFYSKSQRDIDKAWVDAGSFLEDYREFGAMHYGIAPRRLEVMDPQQRLLIEMTRSAIQDAGFEQKGFDRRNAGVYVGVSISEFQSIIQARMGAMRMISGEFGGAAGNQELIQAILDLSANVAPIRAFTLSGNLTALAAAAVAQVHDLGGPAYTLDSACASASLAVHDAVTQLRARQVDAAVAGGAYVNLAPDNLVAFTKIGAISPTGACRPFEARADGFVQSDAVALVFLKRLEDALTDGDRIHAVILGSGANNDGRGEGPMTPKVDGQLDALKRAYADAGVSPASVSFFEAHGTATTIGDPVEVEALSTLLAEHGVDQANAPWIGSVKGNIGHAMSAAGIAGLVKAIKVVEHRTAPPQPNFEAPNPGLGFDTRPLRVSDRTTMLEARPDRLRVGVSSFGFGGTNSHLVLEEAPRVERTIAVSVPLATERTEVLPEAVLVTAATRELLDAHLGALADWLATDGAHASLADVAYTLNARRTRERFRVVIGARTGAELVDNLRRAARGEVSKDVAFFDVGTADDAPKKIAFLFPGQGAQKVGLLGALRARFARFGETFDALSANADAILDRRLADYLYAEDASEDALTATEVCQPAMAALGLTLARLLGDANIQPDVTLGHSLGEFAALAAGGAIDPTAAVELVAKRGAAMRALDLEDTGAMAAVMTDADTARAIVADIDGVVVANVNHPRQTSISGTSEGVKNALDAFAARGIDAKPLSVSHAFHSPLLEGVDEAVRGLLEDVEIHAPTTTVASCIAAETHGGPDAIREVLVAHATAPVEFVRGLEQARDAGANVFVQVGAGAMLTSFARATLGGEHTLVTLSTTDDDRGYEFVRGVATLAALGAPVDFEPLYAGEGRRVVSLPETPIERQSYWPVKDQPQPVAEMKPLVREGVRSVALAAAAHVDVERAVPTSLVELFAQQNRLLQQQAEVMAQQNRLLLGENVVDIAPVAAPTALPTMIAQPTAVPAPVAEPTVAERVAAAITERAEEGPADDDVREQVFGIVAKISAFPRDSLRGEQRLVDELGFDSLMVADLGGALENTYPNLGGLPQELFNLKTTLTDVANHVVKIVTSNDAPAPTPKAEAPKVPASAYRVKAVVRPRPDLGLADVTGQTWLVTEDDTEASAAISAELMKRGATVLRVRFARDGVASPARLVPNALNLWPQSFVDGLPEAIANVGVTLDGAVHAASLGLGDASDFDNPVRLLHPLVAQLDVKRLVVVTGLGGRLGLERSPRLSRNILQSALHGYTKSVARERPDSIVRVLDVDDTLPASQICGWVVDEILGADRTTAVGFDGERHVAELVAAPVGLPAKRRIDKDDVVLITGGAGEIGAVVARWVAAQKPKALLLVGRRQGDDRIAKLVAELGGTTIYVAADATSAEALRTATKPHLEKLGPVTVAFHAAGVIDDAPATKKTLVSVERVMNAKVKGMQALLQTFPTLRDLVLFSSWAGHFGNAGQSDYAGANELLDRIAIAGVGATRVLSVAWPPWSSTSMVASIPETIRRAMAAQGVTFLDDAEGLERLERAFAEGASGLVLVGRDLPVRDTALRTAVDFTTTTHPYLLDHKLNGRPVVPLASATDLVAWTFSEAASTAGAMVLTDLELVRGVFGDDTVEVTLAGRRSADTEQARVEISVGESTAYRAKVATERLQDPPALITLTGTIETAQTTLEHFYEAQTFHGPMLRGIESIERITTNGIKGIVRTSKVGEWVVGTSRTSWTVDPLVVDGSFQLAGYWLFAHHGRAGFPIGFDRFVLVRPFGEQPVTCTIELDAIGDDTFAGRIVYTSATGQLFGWIDGIRGRFAELATEKAKKNGHTTVVDDVARESWDIASFPEVELLEQRFEMARLIGLDNPYFAMHAGTAKDTSVIDGVEMLNYSSYNYLGFSGHPEVVAAAQEAIERYGTSVSASRVASGERPLHRDLETKIADHIGVDDSIVYVSGHATNVTTIGHLFDRNDLIVHDSLIHDSILQGIYLSGATRRPYQHGDLDALERTLSQVRKNYRRVLVCAEGIYSMDGDICDLPRLVDIKKRYKALLLVDEAHSIGVLGHQGRGIAHHFDDVDPRDIDLWMGTLSKSFASCGGYIAGGEKLVRYLKYTAPGFVYSAGITPPNAAAALKSLELMQSQPEVVERLRKRSRFFLDYAKQRGIDTGLAMGAAVVPAIIGNSMDCMKVSQALKKRCINVQPIVYPAVEDDAARLRFFISALHSEEQLRHTVDVLVEELAKVRAESGTAQPSASA